MSIFVNFLIENINKIVNTIFQCKKPLIYWSCLTVFLPFYLHDSIHTCMIILYIIYTLYIMHTYIILMKSLLLANKLQKKQSFN